MSVKPLRCAIYTRKSSEEGLDQDFNSLQAQREACEAYIRSQKGEGWTIVRTPYDDGGFSGGSMKRPAVTALLADVEAGLIDVVVVYKVDRLTRSLTDFSRIVEAFDAKGVSFVSITQSFNTTTSMGRLTLNVLLSFAQFEREVTGERIRDKVAASKAKGMWMGGRPSLGYDAVDRKLVVNAIEAERVRAIFDRYLELGTVHALKLELDAAGAVSKRWLSQAGVEQGGEPFSRGALFHLLKNPIYVGKTRHKGQLHPGLHEAIITQEVFDAVQAKIEENAVARSDRPLRSADAWLKGKIFDAEGRSMSPSFGYGKGGKPFRYYISAAPPAGRTAPQKIDRVSAPQIEALVADRLARRGFEGDRTVLDLRVELHASTIHIVLPAKLAAGGPAAADEVVQPEGKSRTRIIIAVRPVFRGGRTWLVGPRGASPFSTAARDPALIKGLRRGHEYARKHRIAPGATAAQLRSATVPPDSYQRQLVRLAFLAPDIQEAILTGSLPPGITLEQLLAAPLPVSWAKQRALVLGNRAADADL
jgi:site-specific DNA recombinase